MDDHWGLQRQCNSLMPGRNYKTGPADLRGYRLSLKNCTPSYLKILANVVRMRKRSLRGRNKKLLLNAEKFMSDAKDIARFIWTVASNQQYYNDFRYTTVPKVLGAAYENYINNVPQYVRDQIEGSPDGQTFVASIRPFLDGEQPMPNIIDNCTVLPNGSGLYIWGLPMPSYSQVDDPESPDYVPPAPMAAKPGK